MSSKKSSFFCPYFFRRKRFASIPAVKNAFMYPKAGYTVSIREEKSDKLNKKASIPITVRTIARLLSAKVSFAKIYVLQAVIPDIAVCSKPMSSNIPYIYPNTGDTEYAAVSIGIS